MQKVTLLCAMFVLLVTPVLGAQQFTLQESSQPYSITLPHSDANRTLLRYEINRFDLETVEIQGQVYTAVTLDNRALTMERGLPALPTLRESIVIPDDAKMTLRVVEAEYEDFGGIDVLPSKGHFTRNIDPELVDYSFDDFYNQDAWYPEQLAGLDEPYIMRDTRGVVVELNPFHYNPASHTLRVYKWVTLEIVTDGPGEVNVLTSRPARRVAEFESIYQRHYLNYEAGMGERYSSVPEGGSMLIVTYDAYHGAVQPLADWKNQLGLPTDIVDISNIGSTGNQLKAFVQARYDSDGVCYILLVGDDVHVPYLTNNGDAADPMLALLAGSDSYPEAFVGRMSAENSAQVTTQVEKAIEYERDAQGGASWYHKGIGIASAEGSGIGDDGESDWVHMDNIRADLLDFTYTVIDQIYATNGGNATQVSNAVNEGRSIINYCGHGSTTSWGTTGFSNSHVNNLVNDNKLPWIVSVACVNGNFTGSTCFAEAWLRATNSGEPSGAVGMYASTINMQWAPPMAAQDEIVDLLVGDAKRTVGGLCFNGSCQMIDEYGSNGESEFKNWTIFGDPSLQVRSDTPTAITVSHAGQIDPEALSFTVQTAPGALVGLSDDGVYLGSAFADELGEAEVEIVGSLPEAEVTLTVSSFNAFTHIELLPVAPLLMPSCVVEPGSFNEILVPGQILSAPLFVSNYGEPGSVLDYSIQVRDRDNMGIPSWLSLDTHSGSVNYGETDELTVTFDASNLADGTYNADIIVDSNAPESVVVPVTLIVTGDMTAAGETPGMLALGQNFPNPFNPKTSISFTLPEAGLVTLAVYNTAGQKLITLVSGERSSGSHTVVWDGRDAAGRLQGTGIYFYRLETEREQVNRKMTLLK